MNRTFFRNSYSLFPVLLFLGGGGGPKSRARGFGIDPSCLTTFPFSVRVEGLEPPCLAASDPKSDTSTNFATPAF
jgi:hypothetical protein